jgi:SAM-dependent methyltransferase
MTVEEKYSQLAQKFAENSYVNVEEFMNHRLELIVRWGRSLQPGDRVLELGCGDGYLGCLLAGHGFQYTGTDIAPGMVEAARQRAQTQRVKAEFSVMNMNRPMMDQEFEAIVSFRTFFMYAQEPLKLLSWMREHTLKKIVVDWSHLCAMTVEEAAQIVREADFVRVGSRPFLVPMTRRLPRVGQRLLYALEAAPPLGLFLTRRKFFMVIKGDVDR